MWQYSLFIWSHGVNVKPFTERQMSKIGNIT